MGWGQGEGEGTDAATGTSSGTDGGATHADAPIGASHEGAPPLPPWASHDPIAMTPAIESGRVSAMAHWGDDAAPDFAEMLGGFAAKLDVDPADKAKSLESVEHAAEHARQEAEHHVATQGAKVDEQAAVHKDTAKKDAEAQTKQLKQPGEATPVQEAPHGRHGHGGPAAAPVCGPITKDDLSQRVRDTAAREIAELDRDFAAQRAKLDAKLDGKITELDAEQQRQQGRIGARNDAGQATLQADIAGRQATHDAEIAKQQVAIDAEAAKGDQAIKDQSTSDSARVAAEQKAQSDQTLAHGAQKAVDIKAKAATEGANALVAASNRGREYVAAAAARAAKVPEGERGNVTADGEKRNALALLEGQKRQGEITAKGDVDAAALTAEGKQAAGAMAASKTYGASIDANTKAGTDRVDGAARQANTDMKAVSSAAVAQMDAAAATAKQKGAEQGTAAGATMGTAQAEAKAAADQEKAAAIAKMQATHDATKAKIEAKERAELAKIASSKEKDLCKLEKQVSGDLKGMQHMAERADTQMGAQVKLAERHLDGVVAQKKLAMKLAANKAIAAIDKLVADAKRTIKTADKDTLKTIQASGALGKQAVIDTGTQALADVTAKNEAVVQKIGTDGAADRAKLDKHEHDDEAAMAKTVAGTKAAIDDQAIAQTLEVTGSNLQKKAWYDWTSDKQANRGLDALTSLPADVQGKAIGTLPKDQFDNLVSEVPKDRREEFESLVQNTTDPDRKLQLWAGYAKSHAHNEADRKKGDTGHWYGRSDEQKKNKRENDARQGAADHTDDEVDEEVKHLRDLEKSGTPITAAEVDKLYERKKIETGIEMKFAINLTNDTDGGKVDDADNAPTQRRVWSKGELEELDKTLSRLPPEHRDNLKTIRRSGVDQDWNDTTKQWQAGPNTGAYMTPGGEMRFFDAGISGQMRHQGGGETDFQGNPITAIEENIPHELGHSVENSLRAKGKGDIVDRFYKAAGWEDLDEAGMRARLAANGMTPAQVNAQMTAFAGQRPGGVANNYDSRTPLDASDGKVYEIDPYSNNFTAVNANAMPDSHSGGTAVQDNHWGYARSNKADHFAETYMMAVHTPTVLYQDLVGEPTQQRDAAKADVDAAKAAVAAAATPADKTAAEAALKSKQDRLDKANATVDARGKEWSIMRNEVNGTSDVDKQTKADLGGIKTDPAKAAQRTAILKAYEDEAAQRATPEQINLLKAKYQAQLEALK